MGQLSMIDNHGFFVSAHEPIAAQALNFPLPDYSKSSPDKVGAGNLRHVIDENYTRLLLERQTYH